MTIGDTTISQTVMAEGEGGTTSGTYTLTCTSETSGKLHISNGSGTQIVPFTLDGLDLITDSGCVYDSSYGISLREYDNWTRVEPGRVTTQAQGSSNLPFGTLAGALILP
jgi:hypothetical protein